jgi:hypothetical protein
VTELAKADTALFNPARKGDTVPGLIQLDFLTADTDGDTITDGADDNDHDGLSNIEEITAGDDGTTTDPEDPSSGSTDCDADGTPNSADGDDDNDGLSDALEQSVNLSQCNKDTDGDGIEDGFEYWSAVDLNDHNVPYPGKKPYPNALDGSDAGADFDGDGLKDSDEFAAWNLYGGRVLPAGPGQTFPYSGGRQVSSAATGAGGSDYDQNGRLTDDERDADNDGIANWVELARGGAWLGAGCVTAGRYSNCGAGSVPNGDTFAGGTYPGFFNPDWLDPDTDGDGVGDLGDDQDHDGVSNSTEIATQTNPVDPCDPNPESPTCPQH